MWNGRTTASTRPDATSDPVRWSAAILSAVTFISSMAKATDEEKITVRAARVVLFMIESIALVRWLRPVWKTPRGVCGAPKQT